MMRDLRRLYKRSWMEGKGAAMLVVAAASASSAAVLCAAFSITNIGIVIAASAAIGAAVSTRIKQYATYRESRDAIALLALGLSVAVLYLTLM